MSLILEALRKSEAERQRSHAPHLFATPVREPAAPGRTAPRPWWPMAGAALAGAFALAWAVWPRASQPVPGAAQHAVAAPARDALPPRPQPVPPRATSPLAGDSVDPLLPTPAPAPAPPADARAASQAPPAAARLEAPAPPSSLPGTAATAIAPAAPAPLPNAAPLPSKRPDEPARTQPSTDPGTVALSDLATADRQQLPALKMSMHLWAPDAARRFVILDGNRLGEGDRVGNAVVERITADGAVLAWQGRRIRLPMR